jgi:hypothetical protein
MSTEKRGFSLSAYCAALSYVIHAGMHASELSGCKMTTSPMAAVLELSLDKHGLAAERMEPIVDPPLN